MSILARTLRSLPVAGLPALALAIILVPPVAAQDHAHAEGIPEGWMVRADGGEHALHGGDLYFSEMPPGWHITTGPSVILWDPDLTAAGSFRAETEIHLFDPGQRRESFGLFVGGRDLEGPDQEYLYFLTRRDGSYLVTRRDGDETVTLVPWTEHPAVLGWDDRPEGSETALNVLAIEVADGSVRFLANGTEVHRLPSDGLPVDGVVGLRVNHNLNLHVSRLDVTSPE